MKRPERRALTHVGGATTRGGDAELARSLALALEVQSADPDTAQAASSAARSGEPGKRVALDEVRPHVHGFHVYPARLHPDTAANLIDGLSRAGDVVLDPFVGSGTVVVEALAAGRRALGNDLNPLAVELSRCKVHAWTERELDLLGKAAERAAEFADERRRKKAGALRRYDDADAASYPPHILLELDGLRGGILNGTPAPRAGEADERSPRVWRALLLALSSILTKLSYARGDAAYGQMQKRIPSGQAIRLFQRRTRELQGQLAEFGAKVRANQPRHRHPGAPIYLNDARVLGEIADASVDLIVTSPPYAGTYDYLEHHMHRMRWLDLPTDMFQKGELGARRDYAKLTAAEAKRRWDKELHRMLVAMGRVLRPGGRAVLVIGDSAIGGAALRADDQVAHAAKGTGLLPTARASQERPHFHAPTAAAFAERPRREHALLLVKGTPKS